MLCVNVNCDYDGFNYNVSIPIVIACMGNLFHKLNCFEISRIIVVLEFADELVIFIILLVDSLVQETEGTWVFRRHRFFSVYIAAEEHSSGGSWNRRFCSLFTDRPLLEKMKQAKLEEGNGVDHFARIPQELLSLILSRFEDLKHLCGYSLVSKRFASAIYYLKSVHLTLPSTTHSIESTDEICELLPKLAGFTSEETSEFITSSPIKELAFLSFLQNFRELTSISLDFTCPRSICSSSLLKVWVKFGSGAAMVELILEQPAFVPGESSSSDDEDPYAALTDTGMRNETQSLFGCCCVWLLVLCLLKKCHPSLESVTITNSEKEARLFVSNINLLFRIFKSKEAEPGSLNQTLAWMLDLPN
ncbi:uncharacterized protein LOC125205727 isoform X2 [Salvia hispanica]|uniref:uncharacterized protein LOC125205727 isoform X2 n=1 Tax=Salvia hispanica TaxID=49212 RepID=UPI002009C390|nr:uncharacterized protein LOC125205727 isoform X2 [Salvia hispanica]